MTRARDLIAALSPLAAQVTVRNAHWISGPDGDVYFNHGADFCRCCARAVIRHKRRRDRANRKEYRLDGGWRSEHDSPKWCAGCGVKLDVSLTDHAVGSELEHYRSQGVRPGSKWDAHALLDVIYALDFGSSDPDTLADLTEACDYAEAMTMSAV